MLGGWSSIIDPIQLADRGARLSGELPVKGMSRLVEMCRDDNGSVQIELQFDRAPNDGVRTLQGTITAQVNLTCQRCMERMTFALKSTPRLLLLRPGERDDLVESDEALVVEHPTTLGALIEDELLLELPMVPMHPVESCPAKRAIRESQRHDPKDENEKQANPFSVLATWKHSDR